MEEGQVELDHINTNDHQADIFTKLVEILKFMELRLIICMRSIPCTKIKGEIERLDLGT